MVKNPMNGDGSNKGDVVVAARPFPFPWKDQFQKIMGVLTMSQKVTCLECKARGAEASFHFLQDHLQEIHGITLGHYLEKHGATTPVFSNEVWIEFIKDAPTRKGSKRFAIVVKVGDVIFTPIEGKAAHTFRRPPHYQYPREGAAAKAAERVARAIKYGRNTFIYGPAGTGKSAVVRAIAHDMGLECSHYPMREGLDPELYLGKEAVVIDEATGVNKTEFIRGKLLRDLEGRVGKDGKTRGVLILMDDFDRAPAEYHEVFRHILEDNAQNVFVPELGLNIAVHPDTRIVATANSAGRGDATGYYSSVQELDESILDRFERVIEYHFLQESEELEVLKNKFPALHKAVPKEFKDVMRVAGTIREMVANNDIYASFSHRRIVQWLNSATELLEESQGVPYPGLLREAAMDWLEWYDQNTRDAVISRVLDVIFPATSN